MIQKLIEKLNKKRLKERISSAIVMVALIVSISGVVGAVSGIVVSNRYNYALKNYGFSQGDIGKMMITFADTRSYLRAAIGYQDENLVNSCAENYEKKKESCQQYTKEVKNTVSSADEEKIYNSITEKLNDYFDTCDAVLEKGKNTQDIDARHEAQQMAQDQVAPIYEEIYQNMVKLMDANTENGDKLEKILTMVELITLIAIIAVIALAIFAQHIFVPGGLGVFGPVVHGEAFRLGQEDVVVKHRVDVRGYIFGASPTGAAVLDAPAVFLGVLVLAVHYQPQCHRTGKDEG